MKHSTNASKKSKNRKPKNLKLKQIQLFRKNAMVSLVDSKNPKDSEELSEKKKSERNRSNSFSFSKNRQMTKRFAPDDYTNYYDTKNSVGYEKKTPEEDQDKSQRILNILRLLKSSHNEKVTVFKIENQNNSSNKEEKELKQVVVESPPNSKTNSISNYPKLKKEFQKFDFEKFHRNESQAFKKDRIKKGGILKNIDSKTVS